jgi:hypothetical protein
MAIDPPHQHDSDHFLLYKLALAISAGAGVTPAAVVAAFQAMTPAELQAVVDTLAMTPLMDFKGVWDASANSPLIASGIGNDGDVWIVGTPGTTPIDGNADWRTGDLLIFDAASSTWKRVPSTLDPTLFVLKAGDTMTGPLVLAADATQPLEAVTYQQLLAATPPVFVGTDGVTDGAQGVVPQPLIADFGQFLSAGGTWESLPIATTSSLGEVIVGGGLAVDPSGLLFTKDSAPFQSRGLTDLVGNPEALSGPPGTYWNADGNLLRDLEDGNYVNSMPTGTAPWQIFDWDGSTASNIRNLVPGDYLNDLTMQGGVALGIFDDPVNLSYKYLTVADKPSAPPRFVSTGAYLKGSEVFDGNAFGGVGATFVAIHNIGSLSSLNDPNVDPVNWQLAAYVGGMRVMLPTDGFSAGFEGLVGTPQGGDQRKVWTGDATWRAVTLAEPAPTDVANPEFTGNIISRISADETKLFIDYRDSLGNIVSKEVGAAAGPGSTNLATLQTAVDVTVTSDTGTDAVIPSASATLAGVMTSADFNKLASYPAVYAAPVDNLSWTASPTGGTVAGQLGTDALLTLATGVNAGLMSPAQFTAVSTVGQPNTQVVYGTGPGITSSPTLTYVNPTLIQSAVVGDKLRLYNGAAGVRFGFGIQAGTLMAYFPTANMMTWNAGGDLQAPGTNELMRLFGNGNLSLGTSATARSRLDVRTFGAANGAGITTGQAGSGMILESLTTGTNTRLILNGNNGVSGALGNIVEFWGHANGGTVSQYASIHGTQTDGSTAGTNNGTLTFNTANNASGLSAGFRLLPTGHLLTGVSTGATTSGLRFANLTSASTAAAAVGKYLTLDASGNVILADMATAQSNYFRGTYATSANWPTTGGSGLLGAINAGDTWIWNGANGAVMPNGTAINQGDYILALQNIPGQTNANWTINASGSSGFVPLALDGSNGPMTGPLVLQGAPVVANGAATKAYVDGLIVPTNLGYTAAPTQGTVTNSNGTSAVLPVVDATNAGLMIPADKVKLDLYRATPFVFGRDTAPGPAGSIVLSQTPEAATLHVFVNGLLLEPSDEYTLAGQTVTLARAIGNNERVTATYRF